MRVSRSAFAFSSGMSALMCVTRLVKCGERIVTGDDIYGGTSRLLAQVVPKVGIEVVNVDMNDLDAVKRAIDSGPTTMVMLESPTNPRLQITDIRRISEMAHAKGALVCVDNSMMAPVFAAPLELGADISMTSATKFISGQSDITGGMLAVIMRVLPDLVPGAQRVLIPQAGHSMMRQQPGRFCEAVLPFLA